jgi:hypothetical protein
MNTTVTDEGVTLMKVLLLEYLTEAEMIASMAALPQSVRKVSQKQADTIRFVLRAAGELP